MAMVEQNELSQPAVIWPYKSNLDYLAVGFCFFFGLVGIGLLIATFIGNMPVGRAGALVFAGCLIAVPLWVGLLWLKRMRNTRIIVDAGGLLYRIYTGTTHEIPWESIWTVYWYGEEDSKSGSLEFDYIDRFDQRHTVHLKPLSSITVYQVKQLRDHLVRKSGVSEIEGRRPTTYGGFAPFMATRVWFKPEGERE